MVEHEEEREVTGRCRLMRQQREGEVDDVGSRRSRDF